jgi:protein-ribulosamine 3-kinase
MSTAFPVQGSKLIRVFNYGESLWGKTAKVVVKLPSGEQETYFLKVNIFIKRSFVSGA